MVVLGVECIHRYIHRYIHTHVHTYIYTHMHTYILTHTHTHTYIHTYKHTHKIHTHTYTHTRVRVIPHNHQPHTTPHPPHLLQERLDLVELTIETSLEGGHTDTQGVIITVFRAQRPNAHPGGESFIFFVHRGRTNTQGVISIQRG